ncbi:MAG TPA: SLBB domain-containing protein [Gammaproteobacteria bacterium]|nr:SLBB domain-containing protein [Gammaproteobacteria bacterium]
MRSEVRPTGLLGRLLACLLLLAAARGSVGHASGYHLGPGDQISVSVAGSPEFDTNTRIRDDGSIGFPYIGSVKIGGHTVPEAERLIERELKRQQIIKRPQVSINVESYVSKQVTVIGEVHKPGQYGLTGQTTLIDMIARAGGTVEDAADYITLVRKTDKGKKRYHLTLEELTSGRNAGAIAHAGDVIVVPRMAEFYIEGAVNKPGDYRLKDNMTVNQAIAVAGGVTERGDEDDITIKRRGKDGKVHEFDGDLDSTLRKDDVIHIGERWF